MNYELWICILYICIHFPGRNIRARIQWKPRGAPNELHSSRELCHEKACSPGASCFFALPENYHGNGKSPFSIGNTSSNGGFSSALLVFGRGNAVSSWFFMLVEVVGTIRMGSFAVDVPSFEKVALPTLQKAPHVDVYIIDEVPCWFSGCVGDLGFFS